jgi:hypothetical protein
VDIKAIKVWFDQERLFTQLADGRIIGVPIDWYPRLLHAPIHLRDQYELWSSGKWIHWEELDEDLSVEAMLSNHSPQIINQP